MSVVNVQTEQTGERLQVQYEWMITSYYRNLL